MRNLILFFRFLSSFFSCEQHCDIGLTSNFWNKFLFDLLGGYQIPPPPIPWGESNTPCQIGLNKRINYWFNPTLFHSHWRADYLSSQIMVNFHVYMLIKIWGRPHILMKYIALTSQKYKVNLILLSRHCLVNNIRLILINIRWCPCSILLPKTIHEQDMKIVAGTRGKPEEPSWLERGTELKEINA